MFFAHLWAILLGTAVEFYIGNLPLVFNPVTEISKWIDYLDRFLLGDEIVLVEKSDRKALGFWFVFLSLLPVIIISSFFTILFYEIHPALGFLFETLCTYFCISYRKTVSKSQILVETYLDTGIEAARKSLSKLLGKDTDYFEIDELLKADIEYISYEVTGGLFGPFFYLLIFGPVGTFFYITSEKMAKKVRGNHDRYENFDFFATKLDTFLGYLPSRLAGHFTVFVAKHSLLGFDGKNSDYIFMRDRNNLNNKNISQTMAAYAGALDLQLGSYIDCKDNSNEKTGIGDDDKKIEINDVTRACDLFRETFLFLQLILLIFLIILR